MVEAEARGIAETLGRLSSKDLALLCRIFRLGARGNRKQKIGRLVNQPDSRIERLAFFSRLIYLGYFAEPFIRKEALRDILAANHLPVSGNRHTLYVTLIENGKLSVGESLSLISIRGLREIYTKLFDVPALDPESDLRKEIAEWVTERTPEKASSIGTDKPPAVGGTDSSQLKTYGPWGIPQASAVSTVAMGASSERVNLPGPRARECDVAISYASEDGSVAQDLAEGMKNEGIRVFFDKFHRSNLWGKSLSDYFREAFGEQTEYVLVLVSKHYAVKNWTDFEFSMARSEAKNRREEFILPVRLDDTVMVGLRSDVGYLDYAKVGATGVIQNLKEKLRYRQKSHAREQPRIADRWL